MDETQCEIYDPFDSLSPSERSETMSKALSQFGECMRDSNQRILKRVLDIIASTNGDEELHLNVYTRTRTDDLENAPMWDSSITRLSDFVAIDSGLSFWEDTEKTRDYYTKFLEDLEFAVRRNASRELLGDVAVDKLRLPAEYVEFTKHCPRLVYANFEHSHFFCNFSGQHYCVDRLAQSLDKIEQFSGQGSEFEFAAGWKAGENYDNCFMYYALTQHVDEPDGPWRWRIFVHNFDFDQWQGPFDDLFGFMNWLCGISDQISWDWVQRSIERAHEKCKAALEEAARHGDTTSGGSAI